MDARLPGHEDDIVRVQVVGNSVGVAGNAKPYISYVVAVSSRVRNWKVQHRFSEFVELHETLCGLFPERPPPVALPPRTDTWFAAFDAPRVVAKRQDALQTYLQGILQHDDPRWRNTGVWRSFLAPPAGTPAWARPEPGSRRGSAAASGAARRRSQDDGSLDAPPLFKGWGRPLDANAGATDAPKKEDVAARERAELRGAAERMTGDQLLAQQRQIMQAQDETLGELANVVGRQRAVGQAIGDELEVHNELLANLELDLDNTQGNVKQASRRLDRVRRG